MKRFSTYLICVVFLIATGGCGKKKMDEQEQDALLIRAQPVGMRTFERRITVQGSIIAKNYVNVAARSDGNLNSLWVDIGDKVAAGETELFEVDPTARKNALTIAEQALEVSKASYAVALASAENAKAVARKANLDFERYKRLYDNKKISDNEFESAEVGNVQAQAGSAVAIAQVELADRQVKQAEAALSTAQKTLADTKAIAPISGMVSARMAEPGEFMSVGHVVLRIDDISDVEAAAFLPAQYHHETVPGKTKFRLSVHGKDAGTHEVTIKSPVVNPTLRTFEIRGKINDESGTAVPGIMSDLTIVFESREALGVQSASILNRGGKTTVFVAEDGKVVARAVETGLQNDGCTEILNGLKAGEIVVIEGQTQLHDGMAIKIIE